MLTEISIKEVSTVSLSHTNYCTGEYTVTLKIGDHEVSVDGWCVAGWLAPGASQDLDGSGLALWGDSQPGGWSHRHSDGLYSGTIVILNGADDYDAEINIGSDCRVCGSITPSMVPEWQAAIDRVESIDQDADEDAYDAAVAAAEAIRSAIVKRLESLLDDYEYDCPEPEAEDVFDTLGEIDGIEGLEIRYGDYMGAGPCLAWRDADGEYDFDWHPDGTPDRLRRILVDRIESIIADAISVDDDAV